MKLMVYEIDSQERSIPIRSALMQGNPPYMNHCHQEMEILKVRKGILEMTVENQEYCLKPGEICIIPPFVSHSIGQSGQEDQRLAILLDMKMAGGWSRERSEWMWLEEEMRGRKLYSGEWEEETTREAGELIELLYQEQQNKGFAWQFAVQTLVCRLLLLCLRRTPVQEKKQKSGEMNKLKDILAYIALHYCTDLTLGSCAQAVGFNSTYLSRYFSKSMGLTFQEYVKRLRIDRAKWLLMTEDIPVTEVCYQSGFRDIKTFNKLFRSESGMSPTEFRKNLSGNNMRIQN